MIGVRGGARGVRVRVKPRDKPSEEKLTGVRTENLCGRTKRVRLCSNPASVISVVSLLAIH